MPRIAPKEKRTKLLAVRVTEEFWKTLDRNWHLYCANVKNIQKEVYTVMALKLGLQALIK